jgi:uncharacterized Zn-finger protein
LNHHLNPTAFKCDICDQVCKNKKSLKSHKIVVHQNQTRNFQCKICYMRFKTRAHLNTHQLVHQDRKTCDICHKSIAASSYKYHMKLHELKKQEKKFECQVCQKKFYKKQLLISHNKCHEKPLECDLCGHRFGFKVSMKRHLNKHLKTIYSINFTCFE